MFQRPQRGSNHPPAQYDPLGPNPFVPPNLPGGATPSVRMRQMNTETNTQYQARLQRSGAKPPARPVPSSNGLQKQNTESNAQFQARLKRAAGGYPQPPKPTYTEGGGVTMRTVPMKPIPIIPDATSATSPSDLSSPQGKPVAPSPFLPIQPNYIDRTNSHMQRPVLPNEMMPYEQTGRVPMSPGVNESFISGLPSRSERDRSSMQPGGMGDGGTFDAMAAREREARLAPQRALAQREDVTEEDNLGFTRTVDRDPNSPTFGQAKVVGGTSYGPSVPESVRSLIDDNDGDASILYTEDGRDARKALNAARESRRKARLAGEVYTDQTWATTDYGKFNEAREARQERKDAARELRTRRAQLMNYGRTGGVTVAPGGGIAGPMTVGTQATFGPNMSLNQATRMAQGQLDQEQRQVAQEERASDALRRVDRQQAIQNRLQAAQAMQDGPEKDAALEQISNDVLQPSDGSVPKPSFKAPSPDKAVAQSQAEGRQSQEIENDPESFYQNTVPGLRTHLSGSQEDDAYLDNYFDVQRGGSVATPEQIRDNIIERSQGIGAELRFLGDLVLQGAAGFVAGTVMGPLGNVYGTYAGAYKAYVEMQEQQKKYQRELGGVNGYIERRDARKNATSN